MRLAPATNDNRSIDSKLAVVKGFLVSQQLLGYARHEPSHARLLIQLPF